MVNAENLDEFIEKIDGLVKVLEEHKDITKDKKKALREYKELPIDKKKKAWKYIGEKAKQTQILKRQEVLYRSAEDILTQTNELIRYLEPKYSRNPSIREISTKLLSFADRFSEELKNLKDLTEQWDNLQKIDIKRQLYRTFSKLDRRLDEVVVSLSVLSEKDKTLKSATQNAEKIQTQLFTSLIWSLDSLENN